VTDQLSSDLPLSQVREMDDQALLAEMGVRGLLTLPRQTTRIPFQGHAFPNRGKLASGMVLEDRR
jgi:hypothetical protein